MLKSLNLQASFSNHPLKNADVSFQRSTLNAVPTTSSLLNKSKIPFALICTPYRSIKPGDVRRQTTAQSQLLTLVCVGGSSCRIRHCDSQMQALQNIHQPLRVSHSLLSPKAIG